MYKLTWTIYGMTGRDNEAGRGSWDAGILFMIRMV